MWMRRVLAGSLAFLLCSLVLAVAFAIVEEALFEHRMPEIANVEATGGTGGLGVWLAQKVLFALGATALYALAEPKLPGGTLGRATVYGLVLWVTTVATFLGLRTVTSIPDVLWIYWSGFALINGIGATWAAALTMRALARRASA